jgi:DsbC/DsbD-like thiol-disulfide interchange protein
VKPVCRFVVQAFALVGTPLVAPSAVAPLMAQTPVHWTATSAGKVVPGTTVSAQIAATIDPGWHVYSLTQGPGGPIALRITVASGQPFTLQGNPTGPAPHTEFDPNFGITVEEYEERAAFTVPVAVGAAPVGQDSIVVRARYQVCNASLCLPPRTENVAVPVTVAAAGKKSAPTS